MHLRSFGSRFTCTSASGKQCNEGSISLNVFIYVKKTLYNTVRLSCTARKKWRQKQNLSYRSRVQEKKKKKAEMKAKTKEDHSLKHAFYFVPTVLKEIC